jgi:hypothetical protein
MSDTLVDRLDGIVHEETQIHDSGVDLTVAEIHSIDEPGRVDFGGGELTAAESSPVETEKRAPDDDYGWWNLDEGQYLIVYNETLTGEGTAILQTRTELRERGAFHPTLFTDSLGRMPLSVSTGGIRLKENARVSTLLPSP